MLAVRAVDSQTRLLVLMGDLPPAQAVCSGKAGVMLHSDPRGEIQYSLAVTDLGLLLRDRNAVNRLASPVKFAECLACGLPVLVSPGVGDCPEIVRRERVGYILDADRPLSRIVSEIRANRADLRARCRDVATRYFDGDAYLTLYGELVGGKAFGRIPASPSVGKVCA